MNSIVINTVQNQVLGIAERYTLLIEKRLDSVLEKPNLNSEVMYEIIDGIRMINHIVVALERIDRFNRNKDANGQPQ